MDLNRLAFQISKRAEVWRSELSLRFGSDDSGTPTPQLPQQLDVDVR